jgi:hypothetical protein
MFPTKYNAFCKALFKNKKIVIFIEKPESESKMTEEENYQKCLKNTSLIS